MTEQVTKLMGDVREHGARIETNERDISALSKLVDKLRDRLPLWVTAAFTALGSIITYLVTLV